MTGFATKSYTKPLGNIFRKGQYLVGCNLQLFYQQSSTVLYLGYEL